MPTPLYTADTSSNPAYQLNWSYGLFWRERALPDAEWLEPLRAILKSKDHIRLIRCEQPARLPNVSRLLLSTRPETSPQSLAQRIKGRLQHILRNRPAHRSSTPPYFRRNYGLRAIGSANRETLERYVFSQLDHHHPFADPRATDRFAALQIDHSAEIDFENPTQQAHSRAWYQIHLVLVTEGRYRMTDESTLRALAETVERVAKKKGHALLKAGILPDHLHLLLRPKLKESPEEVALGYLNNLAWRLGQCRVFAWKYFVGTFGEYGWGGLNAAGGETPVPPSKLGGDEVDGSTRDLAGEQGSTGRAQVVASGGMGHTEPDISNL